MDKAVYLWTDDEPIDSNHKVNVILGTTCRDSKLPAKLCDRAIESLYGYVNGKPAPTNPETNPETNRPDTPPAAEKEEEAKPSPQDPA